MVLFVLRSRVTCQDGLNRGPEVMGPSGAGKSLLLHSLCGLAPSNATVPGGPEGPGGAGGQGPMAVWRGAPIINWMVIFVGLFHGKSICKKRTGQNGSEWIIWGYSHFGKLHIGKVIQNGDMQKSGKGLPLLRSNMMTLEIIKIPFSNKAKPKYCFTVG